MDKPALISLVIQQLQEEILLLQRATIATLEGATGSENKAESKYDTRSLEASYLAQGQSKRLLELPNELAALEAIQLECSIETDKIRNGSLVVISGVREEIYLILPGGAGIELTTDALNTTVITPDSPLGRKLIGSKIGDLLSHDRFVSEIY